MLKGKIKNLAKNNIVLIFLFMVIVGMSFANDIFFSFGNFINILTQISIYGVVAYGMTFAIICGEFDLSVSSTFALSSVAFIYFSNIIGILPSILLVLCMGALIGLINGLLVSKVGINAFVVTLATMVSIKGIALFWTDGKPIRNNSEIVYQLGNGKLFGVPYIIILFVLVLIISEFVLRKTTFGRNIYATGGNYDVARVAGINVVFYKTIVFVILGSLAALQGTVLALRMGSGSSLFGGDLALSVVAAVVIGGTNLTGGKGSAIKTFLGLLLIGVIFNSLTLLNVSAYYQDIIKGSVLIAVVSFDVLSSMTGKRAAERI
jgi:ribose transport system permease protein